MKEFKTQGLFESKDRRITDVIHKWRDEALRNLRTAGISHATWTMAIQIADNTLVDPSAPEWNAKDGITQWVDHDAPEFAWHNVNELRMSTHNVNGIRSIWNTKELIALLEDHRPHDGNQGEYH